MPRIIMKGNADSAEITKILKRHFSTETKHCSLIGEVSRSYGELNMNAMVFEKYYQKVTNKATLSLIVTGNKYTTIVDAIATTPGEGSMINFSWGTQEDFICVVIELLQKAGLSQIPEEEKPL